VNITTIPRTKNTIADYVASRFIVELLYKPSMLNNISNWKVFEGDE